MSAVEKNAAIAATALEYAIEGHRVVLNGKTAWGGLGNRSGLHGYADELIREKWAKSGQRLQKKMLGLKRGDVVQVQQYRNKTRDRGSWTTVATYTCK